MAKKDSEYKPKVCLKDIVSVFLGVQAIIFGFQGENDWSSHGFSSFSVAVEPCLNASHLVDSFFCTGKEVGGQE